MHDNEMPKGILLAWVQLDPAIVFQRGRYLMDHLVVGGERNLALQIPAWFSPEAEHAASAALGCPGNFAVLGRCDDKASLLETPASMGET